MEARKRLSGDRNQCPTCGEFFNSTRAFDKHRTGNITAGRRCKSIAEMIDAGMVRRDDGFWRGSVMPDGVR